MTEQEREQVLKMIENGTISPESGLKLMQTLDQSPAEEDVKESRVDPCAEPNLNGSKEPSRTETKAKESSFETDPRIQQVKSIVRRLWQIPLWVGVFITILSAWGMYTLVQEARYNFWFYCLNAPLFLGVLVIAAAIGSRKARWLFVDVHQKPGDKPAHIFLGFPLPLKLAAWGFRTFGHYIPEMDKTKVDGIVQVIETGLTGDAPLVVNVDEGREGERVQVYIG
jgi:hypothetical protein